MIYEYDCQQCSRHVRVKRSPATVKGDGPKFCSQQCNGLARRGTGSGPTPNHSIICESCGKSARVYRSPSAGAPRFCSVKCIGLAQHGAANPAYSGGSHVGANGYVSALAPDHPYANVRGYVYEHRLVMESLIGRLLAPEEVVHHRNQIRTDNRPENLQLLPNQAAHARAARETTERCCRMNNEADYIIAEESGANWRLLLGDSCERLAELADESIDLSVMSPPFASLFTYSPSPRDLGNSRDRAEFIEHYGYIIRENLRLTKPGRIACVHVQQLTTTKQMHGYTGLTDFRGDVIRAYIDNGWIFHGEVTVNKDPQAQAIRTKAQALMFVTKNRDSSATRPALADYLLLFRKPGDNQVPIKNDVTNDEWIEWAQPVWWDIRETNTLNVRVARDEQDERHICPLQLDFIERCVRLWSNPGETVLSPFAGIGSEVYTAVKLGRKGIGIELKPSYWSTAVNNLQALELSMHAPSLFDDVAS
jgi:DNA modification methylase